MLLFLCFRLLHFHTIVLDQEGVNFPKLVDEFPVFGFQRRGLAEQPPIHVLALSLDAIPLLQDLVDVPDGALHLGLDFPFLGVA